ncbi:MAG: HEAT repeat domain-containing protein [Acidobacteriota bacterium]|nr:HEAT repeat domain-containing protein [Acidobacteriota bacterium]
MSRAHHSHVPLIRMLVPVVLLLAITSPCTAQQAETARTEQPELERLAVRIASDSRCERLAAAQELARMESLDAGAASLARKAIEDPDLAVRLTSVAALSGAREMTPEVVGGFETALRDADPRVRQIAVRSVVCVKDASAAGFGLLEAASRDADAGVSDLAKLKLRGPEGVRAPAEGVREGGVTGAGEPAETGVPAGQGAARPGGTPGTGAGPGEAPRDPEQPATTPQPAPEALSIDDLIDRLSEPNPDIRLKAAQALGNMGPSAIKALPALQLALTDKDARVRKMAEWAIAQIWKLRRPSGESAGPPPENRIFFLTDITVNCDDNGPELNDEIACESSSSTADLFEFTTLSYLDLAEVARYRDDARKRGLPADKPLAELVSLDPDWEEAMLKFPIAKSYVKDHVVAVVCNGQTRFLHRRFGADDEFHEWGGGEHWGMSNGKYKATVHVFTIEGFRLAFEFEFTFARDGSNPAHLEALKGPADVNKAGRQLIQEFEADERAAAESGEEGAAERALDFRRQRAQRLSGLAGTLWVAVRDLVRFAERTPDHVAPFIDDATAAQVAARALDPAALRDWSTLGEMAYACHVMNRADLWPTMLQAMVWYEAALREVPVDSAEFWDRQAWCGWASAWHRLAQTAITHRNEVDRFWLYQERWLALADRIVEAHNGRPIELGTSKDRDTWPQPGWWRPEWNDILPSGLPEYEPEEEPEPTIARDEERRDLFDALEETLREIDRERALEKKWADGLWDSVRTAERKKTEAVSLLRAQAEMARAIRERLKYLRGLLAKLPETESATYLEAAIKFGIDCWDDAWGPKPQPTDRADDVVRRLISDLTKQHAQILAEQDKLIKETLDTYYDGIILEAEAKGRKANVEKNRDTATRVITDTEGLRALARAELYLASGQGDPFRLAGREAIDAGVPEHEIRMLEAIYFHQNGDVRHALHGYRKVVELLSKGRPEGAPLTAEDARRLLSAEKVGLADRARAMAWTLEHAYLKAIDAKAEGEAADLRGELDQRLAKGGEKGWLGAVVGYLKMGLFSAVSATMGREDALENLASQFQNDVARQHCGILLIQSLHERGVVLEGLDKLSNDEFMKLIRTAYPEAGQSVDADDALRMRAAIKAAYANVDVKRLAEVPKQMLNVDTGTPYFEKSDYQETAVEWWGDCVNLANVLTWLGPGAAWRVNGKVVYFKNWGWIGEARPAASAVVTAKEAASAALGIGKLPALLSQSGAGKMLVDQFSRFFSTSTWVQERGLDMAMQLAIGKVGEATGGTLGVLTGSDGRAEAEAGRLFGELFAAWGAGDVDVMKKIMIQHGITTEHLRTLIKAAEETAGSTRAAGELGAQHSQQLRRALDEIGDGGAIRRGTRCPAGIG